MKQQSTKRAYSVKITIIYYSSWVENLCRQKKKKKRKKKSVLPIVSCRFEQESKLQQQSTAF